MNNFKKEKKQNDVIVSFKTVTNPSDNNIDYNTNKKVKWFSVEVSEHKNQHGELFSIDLNYREEVYEKEDALIVDMQGE
ncbi:MAG: hypothetical protein HYX39_12230 [Bacteroidetes bacterium]|nr:hypothetical protein [Bacteroidota bacterium]